MIVRMNQSNGEVFMDAQISTMGNKMQPYAKDNYHQQKASI